MRFVGLVERWTESLCLWHARFGGTLWSSSLQRRQSRARAGSRAYDETVLRAASFTEDTADERMYAAASRRFQSEVDEQTEDGAISDCIRAVREQMDAVTYASLKCTPSRAIASMFGVGMEPPWYETSL